MHLSTEDQYMYPALLNSPNPQVKVVAERYIDEMGSIGSAFVAFKDNYNTKFKILNDTVGF